MTERTITSCVVTGSFVFLGLDSAIATGSAVSLVYVPPSEDFLMSADGITVSGFDSDTD